MRPEAKEAATISVISSLFGLKNFVSKREKSRNFDWWCSRKPWVLPIMPKWPVRDQWEYPRKMERHFPIKLGQPIEMAAVILNSFTEFPNQDKEPVCKKWNGEFRSEYSDRNMWTTSRSDPDIFRSEETETNDRNFRNLWRNGKHPMKSSAPCLPLTDKMKWGLWLGTRRES